LSAFDVLPPLPQVPSVYKMGLPPGARVGKPLTNARLFRT
jgi:hypothetical protein